MLKIILIYPTFFFFLKDVLQGNILSVSLSVCVWGGVLLRYTNMRILKGGAAFLDERSDSEQGRHQGMGCHAKRSLGFGENSYRRARA